MSQQLGHTNTRPGSNPRQPVFVERMLEGSKLKLLKAPSVDDQAMWKAQAFDFARDRLRGKISATITVDSVIAVIGEYFPLNTMTTE